MIIGCNKCIYKDILDNIHVAGRYNTISGVLVSVSQHLVMSVPRLFISLSTRHSGTIKRLEVSLLSDVFYLNGSQSDFHPSDVVCSM